MLERCYIVLVYFRHPLRSIRPSSLFLRNRRGLRLLISEDTPGHVITLFDKNGLKSSSPHDHTVSTRNEGVCPFLSSESMIDDWAIATTEEVQNRMPMRVLQKRTVSPTRRCPRRSFHPSHVSRPQLWQQPYGRHFASWVVCRRDSV